MRLVPEYFVSRLDQLEPLVCLSLVVVRAERASNPISNETSPLFPIEVYEIIWRYMKVYEGIWVYMNVYGGICSLGRVTGVNERRRRVN